MASKAIKPAAVLEFERLGFGYSEVSQYDLDQLSPSRRVQSREFDGDLHFAPKIEAEQYAAQMHYSVFPPIIVTTDAWLDDGNTRVEACLIRKEKFFPAYILDIEWENATEEEKLNLFALAVTMNGMNGRRQTSKERKAAVLNLIKLGLRNEQIERVLGVKGGTLPAMRRRYAAIERMKNLDISINGLEGSLNQFGSDDVLALNNEPYKTLAELTRDAGIKASEVKEIALAAKATGSDAGAMTYLDERRSELSEQIRTYDLTGTTKPPLARQLRQHLGFVIKNGGGTAALVERNPEFQESHVEYLEKALVVLPEVLEAQKALAA